MQSTYANNEVLKLMKVEIEKLNGRINFGLAYSSQGYIDSIQLHKKSKGDVNLLATVNGDAQTIKVP